MLGTKTITIINRLYENGKESWFKQELTNCAFVVDISNGQSNTTSKNTQNIVCRIPKNSHYRLPSEWKINPNKYFTLQVGDIIIGQPISEQIVANGIEIMKKYKPNSMVIKAIKNNCIGYLDHYKVNGN